MKLYLAVLAIAFLGTGVTAHASEISAAVPIGMINMGIERQEVRTISAVPNTINLNNTVSKTVVADVNSYVNMRESASVESEIVGKLYKDSIGELIEVEGEWIKIESGSVIGYVKSEFCFTGLEAEQKAIDLGITIAKVETETLRVRIEADGEASTLGLIPMGDELLVLEQEGEWLKVEVEEGLGYIHKGYVSLEVEHVYAESIEEERIRLEAERAVVEEARRIAQAVADAQAAAAAAQAALDAQNAPEGEVVDTPIVTAPVASSSLGSEIVTYATQFVGNPYVYGGNDINNGIDCSGFVQYIFGQYGLSLPRTSSSYRTVGAAVNGYSEALPGDIIVYSGHVAIYMGDNKIVHASNARDGIIISNADYRQYLNIRRVI